MAHRRRSSTPTFIMMGRARRPRTLLSLYSTDRRKVPRHMVACNPGTPLPIFHPEIRNSSLTTNSDGEISV